MDDKILWDIIDRLRDEVNIAQDGITDLNDVVKDLQAEAIEQIKDNNSFHGQFDEIQELKAVNDTYQGEIFKLEAENKRIRNTLRGNTSMFDELKAEIKQLKAECWCGGNNDVKAELNALREQELDLIRDKDELKADNKDLISACNMLREDNKSVEVEFARLMKQVGSNRCNSSSTHTHTISKEIEEYMSHNEGCMGARLFLIPRDEFKHGEYDHTIYWDDGIE